MSDHGFRHLRTSAAERERAIDVLKAAFAEGRLGLEEYLDRVEAVQKSRTYADLARLTSDLPVGPLGSMPAAPPAPVPAVAGTPASPAAPDLAGPGLADAGLAGTEPPISVLATVAVGLAVVSYPLALSGIGAAGADAALIVPVAAGLAALAHMWRTGQRGRIRAIIAIILPLLLLHVVLFG